MWSQSLGQIKGNHWPSIKKEYIVNSVCAFIISVFWVCCRPRIVLQSLEVVKVDEIIKVVKSIKVDEVVSWKQKIEK